MIVRDQDFLRVKLARFHRADWQAGGCFYRAVSSFFIKYCGYVGKVSAACIFEVKRCVFVIVLHARPLGGVKCFASVSAVITVKHLPGNFVNGCFFFITVAIAVFSAKGKELTFKSLVLVGYVVIKILENQSIKPTR